MNERKKTMNTKKINSMLIPMVAAFGLLVAAQPLQAQDETVNVVVKVESLAPANGVYFSPLWVGFHDGGFDLFNLGSLAGEAVERVAEDGDTSVLSADFAEATADTGGIDSVITSPEGFPGLPLFDPGEISTAEFTLTASQHRYMTYASMVVPSNDAFIGNHNPWAIELFDAAGNFKGKQVITVPGSRVWDAGTELNNELDAAFINQTAPDTGVPTECPVITHPGFINSSANPGGEPIILGGTNAAGKLIDPAEADFKRPYAVIARITIEPAEMSMNNGMMQSNISLLSNGKGRGSGPVVYVTSQNLFFDSIVRTSLPQNGPFQLLEMAGPSGLQTEFGPGDVGYHGGRWWVDANSNGLQDSEDSFFICPLLPPGRDTIHP
jgi:hypothetical protein